METESNRDVKRLLIGLEGRFCTVRQTRLLLQLSSTVYLHLFSAFFMSAVAQWALIDSVISLKSKPLE